MAKLKHVQAARAARKCGKCGKEIAKGSPYFWWATRSPGARLGRRFDRCQSCKPRPSELIGSPFLRAMAGEAERIDDEIETFEEGHDVAALQAAIEEVAQAIREAGEEAQGSFDNMPEGLQEGETGQLLQQRAERCEEIADELEELELETIFRDNAKDLEWDGGDRPERDDDEPELDKWAETLSEDTRDEGESLEDYAERLIEAHESAINEGFEAVASAVQDINLEVE